MREMCTYVTMNFMLVLNYPHIILNQTTPREREREVTGERWVRALDEQVSEETKDKQMKSHMGR